MFVFNVNDIIEYNEYLSFISSVKDAFDTEKRKLFDVYNIDIDAELNNNSERYFEFRKKYRALRQGVISEVIKKFRIFLPERCLIYEFGSLTKYTDRIESDIDLTFCYDEKKIDKYENVEELINYSIVYVFEQSIDHIHGKFQHYPVMHEFDDLSEADNLYILQFNNGSIEYKCGPETLSENLMNIKNVRDYYSLIEGYREKYLLKCNIDCLYSIEIIENTTEHDFIGDLSKLENENDIFTNYHFDYFVYDFGNESEVSYIKKSLKNTIVSMYILIAFLRKKVKWLSQYSMNMCDVFVSRRLAAVLGIEYIESLKETFIRMIFYWDKIELILKKNDILLSTRCHRSFTKTKLNQMLYEAYGDENMMDKIFDSINNMNMIVLEGWKKFDYK